MQLPVLVVITGLPCTGKTTLARKLAAKLRLPLVSKDDIKERLFDTLGWSDREWSKKLGAATFELMFYFIELELSAGHSLVTEAPFYAEFHQARFQQIQQEYPFRPLVIECVAGSEVLLQRFLRRSEAGHRHPGHVDHTAYTEAESWFRNRANRPPPNLGGRHIVLDTNDFTRLNERVLLSAIHKEMEIQEK